MRPIMVILCVGCALVSAHAGERGLGERLATKLSEADRIEIYSTAEPVNEKGQPIQNKPIEVLSGADIGAVFLSLWRVDESASAEPCMCDGDLYVDFFQSGKPLLRLQYFHGTYFRLLNSSLSGEAVILQGDRPRLREWFIKHGARWLQTDTSKTDEPNQSLEPTTLLGTSAAEQPLVPSRVVAHL